MLSKRTVIGFIIGSVIIGLGTFSLISHLGPMVHVTETFEVEIGKSQPLTIIGPKDSPQSLKIAGNSFEIKLKSPGDGFQIPNMTSYKTEKLLEWIHLEDGETKILIENTGSDNLQIIADTNQTPNPLGFTFDLMVITSGVVIIGFSMGFTLRKPKGF